MGKRWVFVVLLALVILPLAMAHKNPIIKFSHVGGIWEESYYTIPQQPVVNERIILKAGVHHPNDTIEGNVTVLMAIYQDDSVWEWYGGKSYERPEWTLIEESWMQPVQPERESQVGFTEDVVFGQPGSYTVFFDWYESGQYIGQSMHTIDIEKRTVGPMFLAFNALLILSVFAGVWRGIL